MKELAGLTRPAITVASGKQRPTMTEPPTSAARSSASPKSAARSSAPPTMRPDPAGHVIDATSFLGRVVGRILGLWLLFLVIVYHVVLSLLPSRWADGVRSSRTKLADFMAELSVLFFVAPRASLADHLWFVASIVLRPLARTVGPYERRCFSRACRLDPPPYGATVRHVDTVAVGDGQVLRGTLWLPTGAGERFPTVIVRSPYGAQCTWIEWGQIILAERGYAVLLQDTRGRFGSDGMFVPIEQERDDGAATVAWVRQQPWCDGRVGVFGGSYLGLTAWAAVGASPPGALQACVPVITQASIHSAIHGHGDAGGFSLELITYWFLLIDLVALAPTPLRLLRRPPQGSPRPPAHEGAGAHAAARDSTKCCWGGGGPSTATRSRRPTPTARSGPSARRCASSAPAARAPSCRRRSTSSPGGTTFSSRRRCATSRRRRRRSPTRG